MKKNFVLAICAGLFAFSMTTGTGHATTVHLTDFIDDTSRTNFNSFKTFAGSTLLDSGDADYTYDGIRVHSVAGSGIINAWPGYPALSDDGLAWYHNGGDYGYSVITMADNSDFTSVGFHAGHGWSWGAGESEELRYFSYDLFNDGVSVFTGNSYFSSSYLGFSGGGFDEIRIIAAKEIASYIGDGTYQALSLDAIEVSGGSVPVPEPTTMFLMGTGLAGLIVARRKKSQPTVS